MSEIFLHKNAKDFINSKLSMFFLEIPIRSSELIYLTIRDIEDINADYSLTHSNNWNIITSSVDWMRVENSSVEDLFSKFHLPAQPRPNSHRAEVLLSAVTSKIVSDGASGWFSKGIDENEILPIPPEKDFEIGRYLMFRI